MRRSRKRGPGALLRDERRRLARIDPDVLIHDVEVKGAIRPPSALGAPLTFRSDNTLAPALALSDEGSQDQVAKPGSAAAAARTCKKCKMPCKGHPGPTGLDKCLVSLSSPERLRDSSIVESPSLDSTVREIREEPPSPAQSLPPPSPGDVKSPALNCPPPAPNLESPPATSHKQQQPLLPMSPAPPLHAPSPEQWPFQDLDDVIVCRICEMDGDLDNIFVGNYAISKHIVEDHNQFCNCVHCECALPDEDGIFHAHMEQCLPCPGFPRCPFEEGQCPSLGLSYPPSDYCATPLD